jgi:hypothetical protein
LTQGLDPTKHFSQSKQFIILKKTEDQLVIDDIVSAKFQTYQNLTDDYRLLATLNPNENFNQFEFVLTWNELSDEQRRTLYSKHACHEPNFFLWKKDPTFFENVVAKHLSNKRERILIDEWLINANLNSHLGHWKYTRLNAFERILLAQRSNSWRIAKNNNSLILFIENS